MGKNEKTPLHSVYKELTLNTDTNTLFIKRRKNLYDDVLVF